MQPRLIVVDGNHDDCECVRNYLITGGYTAVDVLPNPLKALALLESGASYDVALLAVESMEDAHLLRALRQCNVGTECILLATRNRIPPADQGLWQGAYDCLAKPFSVEGLLSSIKRALERKRLLDLLQVEKSQPGRAAAPSAAFQKMITCSRPVLRVLKEAELLAASDVPIMITGESGTGKEWLARAVHAASSRAGHPFRRIPLQGRSPESIEEELFGPSSGAPHKASPGLEPHLLASCNHGTLFLKSIEVLAPSLQGRLSEVILGDEVGAQVEAAGVRLIMASDEGLEGGLKARRLCNELVYWIRGSWLHLPALRERPEDIPLLIDHFLTKDNPSGKSWQVEETALRMLQSYLLPGNVGELRTILRSAAGRAQGRVITSECLPELLRGNPTILDDVTALPLAAVEKQHILKVYAQMGRNKVRTARALGVGLNTLRRKLKTYEVK
ncbi:MAG: sigma-54-dependent transcriptional regulator [Hyphomicrobiales bacterium]